MKKEQLHQQIITAVVAFSLLSFVFLNFFTTSAPLLVKTATPLDTAVERIEKDDATKAAPKLVFIGHLFELAKKIVPGK